MSSVSSTDTLNQWAESDYRWGFVTDIDADTLPPGLNEDVVRHISRKKNEPEWLLEWRLKALRGKSGRRWPSPTWANGRLSRRSTIRPSATTRRPSRQGPTVRRAWTRSIPKLLETYEKLGIPLHEREDARRVVGGRCGVAVDSTVSVATTFKEELAKRGIIFCSFSEAVQEHPELVREVPGFGGAAAATTSSRRSTPPSSPTDRSCYIPKGVRARWSCRPTSASTRCNDRPVRAHADRRRGRCPRTSATSRAAPPRCATRTSCTPPWSSWSRSMMPRSSTRPCRTGTPATRTASGGIYNFVTKRGPCPAPHAEDLLDPGRDRVGDHVEVPELRPAR